jgi:hypothetical protein
MRPFPVVLEGPVAYRYPVWVARQAQQSIAIGPATNKGQWKDIEMARRLKLLDNLKGT